MKVRRFSVFALGVAGGSAAMVLFAAEPAPAGEKIEFSDPQDDFRIPAAETVDPLSRKSFEFLDRGSSVSGVIDPRLAITTRNGPSGAPSGKLLELYQRRLDEKKNWIYQRPDDANAGPTWEEVFEVRSSGKATELRGRSVLAEFFENSAGKPPASRPADPSREAPDRIGISRLWDLGSSVGSRTEITAAGQGENALDWRVSKSGFSVQSGFVAPNPIRPDESLDPTYRPGRGRDTEKLSRSDEFRKLLVIQNGINPLATGFDPINLRGDNTRQELNPITPAGLDSPLVGAGGIAGPVVSPVGGAGRAGSLLGSGATLVGSSSLAPAVPTSVGPPRQLRQPIILEMPRRKF